MNSVMLYLYSSNRLQNIVLLHMCRIFNLGKGVGGVVRNSIKEMYYNIITRLVQKDFVKLGGHFYRLSTITGLD